MHIDLPQAMLDPFNRAGVMLRVYNVGNTHVPANQQFEMAGELESVAFVEVFRDRGLKAKFRWLAERKPEGWIGVTEETQLELFFSLHLFSVPSSPRQGELVLQPRTPIAFETWHFYDPKFQVELPLRREDILVPAM